MQKEIRVLLRNTFIAPNGMRYRKPSARNIPVLIPAYLAPLLPSSAEIVPDDYEIPPAKGIFPKKTAMEMQADAMAKASAQHDKILREQAKEQAEAKKRLLALEQAQKDNTAADKAKADKQDEADANAEAAAKFQAELDAENNAENNAENSGDDDVVEPSTSEPSREDKAEVEEPKKERKPAAVKPGYKRGGGKK